MKICAPNSVKILLSLFVITAFNSRAYGDIILVDNQSISVQQPSGGGFFAGGSTFDLTGLNPLDVELVANFDIVDAGVEIVVNGSVMPLFPPFDDISEFGPTTVFTGTGVQMTNGSQGNISLPFSPNSNGLPRLTVTSDASGTVFSGAAFVNSTSPIVYTPTFAVQDFTSLLNPGSNTIEFFVLNSFQGANLQGDFTVTKVHPLATVPEPGVTGLGLLALAGLVSRRRR